jgi:hypothetical protein
MTRPLDELQRLSGPWGEEKNGDRVGNRSPATQPATVPNIETTIIHRTRILTLDIVRI